VTVRSENPVSRKKGSSFDLKNIREYQPFDDLRKIDWQLYGRSDRIYVKEFYEEENERIFFLIDNSASIPIFDTGYYRAFIASLAYILLRLRLSLHLIVFNNKIVKYYPGIKGEKGVPLILNMLNEIEFEGRTDITNVLKTIRNNYQPGTVFLFSDLFDSRVQPASVFRRMFLFHFFTPFHSLIDEFGEVQVYDSELEKIMLVPYNRITRNKMYQNHEAFLSRFHRGGKGYHYFSLEEGAERVPHYWTVLETLYG